jgi:hypothetical protein
MAGVGNAGARMWGSGGMAFAVTLIGRGRAGQFVRMANVCLGGVMSGLIWGELIWGELIWGGALALKVLRLRGSGGAAMGFWTESTEWRSWESQAIAAAIASPSAYCTPINADHERMLFALVSESASSENLPESVGLAIPVPLPTVLASAEECCSRAGALGASLISRAHSPRQLAASAGYSASMRAAK